MNFATLLKKLIARQNLTENEAFDAVGVNPGTGTTSPSIARTQKQPAPARRR